MRRLGLLLLAVCGVLHAEEPDYFGRKDTSQAGLIGILYDFKQTQKREPTGVVPDKYLEVLNEFVKSGWDESVINRFFRSARPLSTTQIFVPFMNANKAPEAFGVEKVVQPAEWMAHYKGQVSPPKDGKYRFIGYSDDAMAVAVNGQLVLYATYFRQEIWNSKVPEGSRVANGTLKIGDWVELKKDVPVDFDVLIGEQPGGSFCAFLLYEREGETYQTGEDGHPVYPVFQLAPYDTPALTRDLAPPFAPATEVWKGYQ